MTLKIDAKFEGNLASNFIKKDTLAQVFSCKFSEISKNTFYTEQLQTAASGDSSWDKSMLFHSKKALLLPSVWPGTEYRHSFEGRGY